MLALATAILDEPNAVEQFLQGEHAWVGLVVLWLAGLAAGVINAMAGGGSFLAIPLLMAMGLPVSTANGTIRVGVLLQNVSATVAFWRKGMRELATASRFLIPIGLGAFGGSMLAARLDDAIMRPIFGVAFLAWAVLLLTQPKSFTDPPERPRDHTTMGYVFAFLIGVYGGFLQSGVGFPLIALLVMYLGYDPVRANAIKVLLVGMYTLIALPVFAYAGRVAWLEGIVLAVGMSLGGWVGARWQLQSGAGVVRWFVMIAVTVAGIAMLAPVFG